MKTGLLPLSLALSFACCVPFAALAQENVRPIPPPGVAVPASDKAELETGAALLGASLRSLQDALRGKPALLELLPDVQIYYNAVRYAVTYNEFFNEREIGVAKTLLKQGMERAAQLREGKPTWTTQTGLVVRGYVSKIDGSVQPYGLVVPASWQAGGATKHRLDFWFHGRGENLSEVNFLNDRQNNRGEFTPPDTFVLHPYGRYCNANKLAGEVDLFEALAHAKRHYPIDENRVTVRGFSMGGAACWQFAAHYAGEWAAAAPGAGFSETADFTKIWNDPIKPTWYEQKLWHVYDCTDYALNLFNLPTVAYSGEKDGQKQSADMMAKALKQEGIELVHVIGANAGHFYTPDARAEINRRLDSIAAIGRNPVPMQIRFTTWTLRYNKMRWLTLDGLEKHWERARVEADILNPQNVQIKTKNVSALTLEMRPGQCPLDPTKRPTVALDGQKLQVPAPLSDRSWHVSFRKTGGKWSLADKTDDGTLRKRPGLQGPIDDAFMDSFIMVTPTGTPLSPVLGAWTANESEHAIDHWRKQFRGEARVKKDTEITADDIANSNLILWGDGSSNKILAQILAKLPIQWDAQGVKIGTRTFGPNHALLLIYPNPLNPKHYVVLNSGVTFREFDNLNNARQVPKLPDYALVDATSRPTPRTPGTVVTAGFFDDNWAIQPNDGK